MTIYKVLNALWKKTHLLKSIPESKVEAPAEVLKQVIGTMKILDLRGLEEEILRVAIQPELTAYDSSYIVIAMKHGLTLVTGDNKLREKAENLVKAISLDESTTL
ncbi:MAG: type II toxin-antitoxin system VapC family toxin [Desulfurococcaceae archaeon]